MGDCSTALPGSARALTHAKVHERKWRLREPSKLVLNDLRPFIEGTWSLGPRIIQYAAAMNALKQVLRLSLWLNAFPALLSERSDCTLMCDGRWTVCFFVNCACRVFYSALLQMMKCVMWMLAGCNLQLKHAKRWANTNTDTSEFVTWSINVSNLNFVLDTAAYDFSVDLIAVGL